MKDNKIKLIFTLIGISLLMFVEYLGTVLFYIAGLLIPVVFIIIIFSAMYFLKKNVKTPISFARLFKLNLTISYCMVIINFLFLIICRLMISSIQEGALSFLFNLAIASLLSAISAYIFVKSIGKVK
jgi:hypothetical protein